MKFYNLVEKFVRDSFSKINKEYELPHFERTVYWIKTLKPDADEALLISAFAHDIERAHRQSDVADKKEQLKEKFIFNDPEYIGPHQERGAQIVKKFLKENNAGNPLVEKCGSLIARHEEGGSYEQNILKDADSISFFENNVGAILKNVPKVGKESVRGKLSWMFNRITSERAKEICKEWYGESISKLNSYN